MSLTKNSDRFGKMLPWLIFLSVLIIYLAFPTKNYYWDGVEFALAIEEAPNLNASLLHPNHLFYNFIGYGAYHLARTVFPAIRALEVLQIISSFFGAASVAFFYVILKRIFRREYLKISLTALFAFSATWWKFSTDGGSYIPSIFFMLVSFYLILPREKPRPLLVALAHAAAMFFHQLAVFFFPVIVVGIVFQTLSLASRKRIFAVLQYVLPVFILTFGTFCLSFYQLRGAFDLKGFFTWVTWFSPEVGFVFNLRNVLSALVTSHVKLFFEGRIKAFKFDAPDIFFLALLIFSVVLILTRILRDLKIFGIARRVVAARKFYTNRTFLLCAAWIIPCFLFLSFFIPGNTFYKLFYLPPVIIVIGLIAEFSADKSQIGKWRTGLLAGIVFLANFIFFVNPSSDVRADSPLSLALEMRRRWTNNSVIYYGKINTDTRLVKYFNRNTNWIKLDSAEEFADRLYNSTGDGETIWIDDTALRQINSTPELTEKFAASAVEKERFKINDPAHDVKFIRIEPKF